MDLERDALRPGALELRRRQGGVEEEGPLRTGPRLRQHLRRHHAEREAAVDELVREILGRGAAALEDRAEADLSRVRDAVVDRVEGLALVEVGRVHYVALATQPVRERHDPGRQPERVVEEQDLGHGPKTDMKPGPGAGTDPAGVCPTRRWRP